MTIGNTAVENLLEKEKMLLASLISFSYVLYPVKELKLINFNFHIYCLQLVWILESRKLIV